MKNSVLSLSAILIFATALTSCSGDKKDSNTSVTGKGNGGDVITMSEAEIKAHFEHENFKPNLVKIFEALKALNEAEALVPDLTDLSKFPKLRELISVLFKPGQISITDDIRTSDNIKLQSNPCVTKSGDKKYAASEPGEKNGEICFSLSMISKMSPKGADKAIQIQVLALTAHEFGHHFLNNDDEKKDESLLRVLQAFVHYQLTRFFEQDVSDLATSKEMSYVDRFLVHAERRLKEARISSDLERDGGT